MRSRPEASQNEKGALGALAIGLGAGVIGTSVMTAWQEVAARLRRSMTVKHMDDEDPWAHAPAPAQVGRLMVKAVSGREVPPERIPLFTNAVHWGFGTVMGGTYGLAHAWMPERTASSGSLFGLGVWAQSYATLVPMGLYKPPWQYPAKTIAKDISYHLTYGAGVAVGYKILDRATRR